MYSCLHQTQELWIIDASVCGSVPFFFTFLFHHALQSPRVTDSCDEPRHSLSYGCSCLPHERSDHFQAQSAAHLIRWMPRFLKSSEGIFCLWEIQCDIIMQRFKDLEQRQNMNHSCGNSCVCVCICILVRTCVCVTYTCITLQFWWRGRGDWCWR